MSEASLVSDSPPPFIQSPFCINIFFHVNFVPKSAPFLARNLGYAPAVAFKICFALWVHSFESSLSVCIFESSFCDSVTMWRFKQHSSLHEIKSSANLLTLKFNLLAVQVLHRLTVSSHRVQINYSPVGRNHPKTLRTIFFCFRFSFWPCFLLFVKRVTHVLIMFTRFLFFVNHVMFVWWQTTLFNLLVLFGNLRRGGGS